MAGPWDRYTTAEPQEAEPQPWERYQTPEPMPGIDAAHMAGGPSYQDVRDHLEPVAEAFGQGFREGWGPEKWGLSEETIKDLSKRQGLLGTMFAAGERYDNPLQAFNELFYESLARVAQVGTRGTSAIFRGTQAAIVEAGLPRDVAALPEAFFGSPHPTGMFKTGSIPRPIEEVTPARPAPALVQARELGLVGPERPEPTFKDSPSELAERAVPRSLSAAQTPEELRTGPLGHQPGEYDARGKAWIDKIDEPEDVRNAIEQIASERDYFPEARGGVASEASRRAVAEAAGVDPAAIDVENFSRYFDSDGKVRAVIQIFRQTAKDFSEASDKAVKEPSMENAAAAVEAELRATHVLEYTLGLRAEGGRTLNAWKELLRETERTKAQIALRKGETTGDIPAGTSAIVDAASEVKENLKDPQKKPGLLKLIEAAQELVGKEDKATPRGPMSPEVVGLIGEARKTLNQLGAGEPVELSAFRERLDKLASGEGKLSDVVDAARELLKATEKPKPQIARILAPSEKGRLLGAAKRLVAASDKIEAEPKAPMSPELTPLMETARQAVGRIKDANLRADLSAFREALNDKDPQRAVAAANRLIEKDTKRAAAGEPKPPVEHDVVMAAARRIAQAGEETIGKEKPTLPPDITSILDEAKEAVSKLQAAQKSELGKLIDVAEKQAVNMTRQKAVKEPVEALPPELQALLDKTQRVVDRFGGVARGERAALLLAQTGRTVAEQEQLARSVSGLTPNQVAKVLEKLRTSSEAQKPGWFYWLWQQGLISGLITHTGYAIVNTATVLTERVIAPTLSAVMDKLRGEDVSVLAPLYGGLSLITSLPDAFAAAGQAFKTGTRIPLRSEIRLFERGEESPQTKGAAAAYTPPGPDWGIWTKMFNEQQLDKAAAVLGIPGRSANLLHTFYKILSEQASLSTRAYNAAFEEGVRGDKFWQRYQYHLDNPTDAVLRDAVNDAYTGAFMARLGPKTEKLANTLKTNPILKWAFPFQHIPWNIERMSVEYSPFAVLGPEMRSALLGQKGVPAQNLAMVKMMVGSSVLGYFIHKALAGEATGDYPIDAKERQRWNLLRIPPNSIQMGGQWVSLERLGPAGNVAHIGASIGEIIHNYDGQDDDALTKAIWSGVMAAANQVGNEVGFQTLRNFMESLTSEKKAERFVGSQAGSFIYPSSFLGQMASFIDPYARESKTILDGLKNKIPVLRESLLPKRDPLYGEPIPNPGHHTIKRMTEITTDPVKLDMDRLKYFPSPPQDRISGVKLTPELYGRYEAVAGALTKEMLNALVSQPGWFDLPPYVREDMYKKAISTSRESARSMIQAENPRIIQQALDDMTARINGGKATKKLKD